MKQLREFFTENFESALNSIGIENLEAEKYIIVPTADEEKYTTMDEIYRLWDTPSFLGIRISYESVLKYLVKEKKKVSPLWIKVHYEKGKPIVLEISQRFRKMRDIILRRRDNEHPPFVIAEDPLVEFSESKERAEAIRILFFKREMSSDIKHIIDEEITYNEVIDNFKNHFERYRFYPPSYKKVEKGEDGYSSIVLVKDIRTERFSVFKNPDTAAKIKSNLDFEDAVKYYIQEELAYKICGLEIEK